MWAGCAGTQGVIWTRTIGRCRMVNCYSTADWVLALLYRWESVATIHRRRDRARSDAMCPVGIAVDAHAASARCHVHCVHCRDRRSRLMSFHMRFHAGTPLPLPLSIAGRAWQQLRCLAKCCMLHAMLSAVLHLARLTPHCRCASPSTSPAHDPFSSARTNHGHTPTLPLPLPPASDLQRFAFGCAHNLERAARRPL